MEIENYFFDVQENTSTNNLFVLIIYDIENNKQRNKLAKLLSGYGFRVQKSAFEAMIPKRKYDELIERLPAFVSSCDSIRVYKIIGKGQVVSFGKKFENEQEDIVVV